jgi:hypothetical protein
MFALLYHRRKRTRSVKNEPTRVRFFYETGMFYMTGKFPGYRRKEA